jgi:hypothetical protein
MCLPAAGAGAAALSTMSTVVGMIGTVAGIAQGQQQAAFAQQQANLQLQQQRQQTEVQNQQLANDYVGQVAQRDAQIDSYNQQVLNNQNAANQAFAAEQTKLDEAKTKAAFKSQEIYAKSIGAKGSVLATGATGQSVGLLALDADRQAGLGIAEQDAAVDSAAKAAAVGAQMAADQQTSANNEAFSRLAISPAAPIFSPSPGGGSIDSPSYNWFN